MLYFDTITGESYSGVAYLNDDVNNQAHVVRDAPIVSMSGPIGMGKQVWHVYVAFNNGLSKAQHRTEYISEAVARDVMQQFTIFLTRCLSANPASQP
jgi:hypothetical protein